MPRAGGREAAGSAGTATQRGLEVPPENQGRDYSIETGSLVGPCLLHLAQPVLHLAGSGPLGMMSSVGSRAARCVRDLCRRRQVMSSTFPALKSHTS